MPLCILPFSVSTHHQIHLPRRLVEYTSRQYYSYYISFSPENLCLILPIHPSCLVHSANCWRLLHCPWLFFVWFSPNTDTPVKLNCNQARSAPGSWRIFRQIVNKTTNSCMGLWELDMTGQLVVRHQWKWIAISHSSGVTRPDVNPDKLCIKQKEN